MPHLILTSASKSPAMLSAGDEMFHFRLVRELGRGAFARVFLAEQSELGSRRVVVKCTTTEGCEPQTLAQLQHTNIVPIHSVHEDTKTGLRAVCMPYFGGASLAQVLGVLRNKPSWPVRGEELVRALETAQHAADEAPLPGARRKPGELIGLEKEKGRSTGPTPLDLLKGLSFLRAAAWIVARLADGLQHAHQRGVLHYDIKPSNILLGADGQPMLLDFNLSRRLHDEQAQAAAVLGGTATYMAPEHLRALTSKECDLHHKVDHRSDVYSLGIVLFEILTGQSPFKQNGTYSALPVLLELMAMERIRSLPSARQKRSDIAWSLESILRKCLHPDPAQRYQQAAHLAADLRRFLEDQPLRYAPELSQAERVRKWFCRHPRLTSSVTVAALAAVILVGVAGSLVGIRQNLIATQRRLETAQAQERKRAFEKSTQHALGLLNTAVDQRDHLQQGKKACQDALALYEILDRDDWQERPAWQELPVEERQRLGEDVRELLLLLAAAKVRLRPKDGAAPGEALALLDKAEAVEGLAESRALWEDRAFYLKQSGDAAAAAAAQARAKRIPLAGVRDHYLIAVNSMRQGRHAEAISELNQALKQNPLHYWSSFQRGVCQMELGKFSQAAGDFGVCIGLWPEFALGYFNRGYSLDQSGDKAAAVSDYTAAIERNATLAPAYITRGLAFLELNRCREALEDFQKCLGLGREDAIVHAGRGVALEGLGRFGEADDSFRTAFDRARSAPKSVRMRIQWVYGLAVCKRRPDQALKAFEAVLAENPNHAQALYGRAMLLAEKGQVEKAVELLDRAIAACPNLLKARRCRAVLQARRGNFDTAREDINACLAHAPDSGSVLYAAACIAAWEAKQTSNRMAAQRARAKALAMLEKAFARGYRPDNAGVDPDLAGVREDPEFQRLLHSKQTEASVSRGVP